ARVSLFPSTRRRPFEGRSAMSLSRRDFFAGSIGALSVSQAWERQALARPVAQTLSASPGELHYLTLRDAATRIRARQISPVELTKAILARIDQVEPKVHAFITLAREAALESARTAEREIMAGRYRGPLHGIPA